MYSSLSYLTRKASFKPVGPYPVTQTIPNLDSPETFKGTLATTFESTIILACILIVAVLWYLAQPTSTSSSATC